MDMLLRLRKYKIIFLILIILIFYFIIRQSIHFLFLKSSLRYELNEIIFPKSSSFNNSLYRIHTMLHNYQEDKIPVSNRNLIIFHIGDLSISTNSIDVIENNIKIFVGSLLFHSENSTQKAFYLFNIVGGLNNPLTALLPSIHKYKNIAILDWDKTTSDVETHYRTISLLGYDLISQFYSVIFLNQGVRGPLAYRKDGEWITQMNKLMHIHNIALVGPTLSCEMSPHIQTHVFALKSNAIPVILDVLEDKMKFKSNSWKELIESLEVGLTSIIRNAGYNISSLLYHYQSKYPYFENKQCMYQKEAYSMYNPVSWCIDNLEQLIFMKWGGTSLRVPGVYCNETIIYMRNNLYLISKQEPQLELKVPETLRSGYYYKLYHEYDQEVFLDNHYKDNNLLSNVSNPIQYHYNEILDTINSQKVCFMVRVTNIDEKLTKNAYSKLVNKDVELFMTTLRRQTNPNWLAYFYLISKQKSLESTLLQLVHKFNDSRLSYIKYTNYMEYTAIDAGYSTTDIVFHKLLQQTECEWITLTTGDNAYGSEVVQNVLNTSSSVVDMVINPMDSKRYLEQEEIIDKQRKDKKCTYVCERIFNISNYNYFIYPMQPIPDHHKRIESASVFLSRKKLLQEKIYFSYFTINQKCNDYVTDPIDYPCLGYQASKLISYLHFKKNWTYKNLFINGIKSMIFHGPSPTLCIASGHVWLDHPDPHVAKCISYNKMYLLRKLRKNRMKYKFSKRGDIEWPCLGLIYYPQSNFPFARAFESLIPPRNSICR